MTPGHASQVCGVPTADIVTASRLYGRADKAMLNHARGLEHQIMGTRNAQAAINLCLATGNLGRPGAGYGTITGQGNGQGGREHGQKCDQLPGQRKFDDPGAIEHTRAPATKVGAVTGFVGAAGGLGGFFPPLVMGAVFEATGSYAVGLALLSLTALAGVLYTYRRFVDVRSAPA